VLFQLKQCFPVKYTYEYLRPKDKDDWKLILSDEYYKDKEVENVYQDL
jgi:hypothetical protein